MSNVKKLVGGEYEISIPAQTMPGVTRKTTALEEAKIALEFVDNEVASVSAALFLLADIFTTYKNRELNSFKNLGFAAIFRALSDQLDVDVRYEGFDRIREMVKLEDAGCEKKN